MKISAKSWHYRVIHNSPWYIPNNLCKYFWVLIAAMLRASAIFVVMVLVIGVIAGFAIFAALAPLVWLVDYFYPFIESEKIMTNVEIGAFIGTGLYAYTLGSFLFFVHKQRQETAHILSRGLPPAPPKEPGIVAQRYRDFKDKTCTLITFTDKPEDDDDY